VALTKAQRAERRAEVLEQLRNAWRPWLPLGQRVDVELVLQRGRRRPRVRGLIAYMATSGAFVLMDDGGEEPLHVPIDVIRSVRTL
jgi:hypothetical protein